MSDDEKKAVVLPLAHNGKGDFRALVLDEGGIHPAEFHRIEEGKPIMGEYVEMTPRDGSPLVDARFRRIPGVPDERSGKGPAKVNSRAYAEGYDRIFGKKNTAEA